MFYSFVLNKLSVFVQLSSQIQTHLPCFVKKSSLNLANFKDYVIFSVNSWKYYPTQNMFYTSATCATCDKFYVWAKLLPTPQFSQQKKRIAFSDSFFGIKPLRETWENSFFRKYLERCQINFFFIQGTHVAQSFKLLQWL